MLITRWLDGAPLSALLDGRTDLLPEGWRELRRPDAADLAARLLGHAIYAPAACTGWMHADLHPGNFLLLPGGRLGMLDFGAAAATPGGIPAPFGSSPPPCWPGTARRRSGWPARPGPSPRTPRSTRG